MKPASKLVAATVLAAMLASCASGPRGPRYKPEVINRALSTAPGEAQPSTVVATEVALSQAENEIGVLKAKAQFAAPGAVWHLSDGPVGVSQTLPLLKELDGTADWGTRTVVMSCDGGLAIAAGRFLNPQGKYGDYLTTWVRQKDNSYKWTYTAEWIDDPQPPPRKNLDDENSLITVTTFDSVQGLIADCPRGGAAVPPPPALSLANDYPGKAELSRDGTLRWHWEHRPDGTKFVSVDYFYGGGWVTAIQEGLASAREE